MLRLSRALLLLQPLSPKDLLFQVSQLSPQCICVYLVRVITKAEVAICVRVNKTLQVQDFWSQRLSQA